MVIPLRKKSNSMYIWCFAHKFVQKHGLAGLNSGMFISEVREANSYCFEDIEWDTINQSNEKFAWIILYVFKPICTNRV